MPKTSNFDFRKPVGYDGEAKRAFHKHARRRLKELADALGLAPQNYDLRSNVGAIAVSGEVTRHADRVYVQACQPTTGHDTGLMFRTCEGRKRLSWRSQSLRLHRPSEPARRPGAPHQGGMPSLISLRLILYRRGDRGRTRGHCGLITRSSCDASHAGRRGPMPGQRELNRQAC